MRMQGGHAGPRKTGVRLADAEGAAVNPLPPAPDHALLAAPGRGKGGGGRGGEGAGGGGEGSGEEGAAFHCSCCPLMCLEQYYAGLGRTPAA
jgi:hypothetical protein